MAGDDQNTLDVIQEMGKPEEIDGTKDWSEMAGNRTGTSVKSSAPYPPLDQINITTPDAVFEAVEKLRFYLSCEAELYLNIGKILVQLTMNKRYKLYGSHIETMNDFLKEIGLKRSTAYTYMDVWKTFGSHLNNTSLTAPYKRLIEALPLIKSDDDAVQWIERAKVLTPTDYKAEVYKARTGVSDLECDHAETESYERCLKCGKWLRK